MLRSNRLPSEEKYSPRRRRHIRDEMAVCQTVFKLVSFSFSSSSSSSSPFGLGVGVGGLYIGLCVSTRVSVCVCAGRRGSFCSQVHSLFFVVAGIEFPRFAF